jgi:hypothetical protein
MPMNGCEKAASALRGVDAQRPGPVVQNEPGSAVRCPIRPRCQVQACEDPLVVLFAFGVGLANFASGRDRQPREIVAAIADALPLIASYGHTGNVALDDGDVNEVRSVLEAATGRAWAVVGAQQLNDALTTLAALPTPPPAVDERPTPGIAFAVTRTGDGDVVSNERAYLHRISEGIVAVWKLDLLRAGTLDRDRRRGGWGAISTDIARQVRGQWTARSRRTLDGLRKRALN